MSEYSDASQFLEDEEKQYRRWLKTRPLCKVCLQPIEARFAYRIDDEWICEDCIDEMRELVGDEEE